ncbi:GNAT family N-acetyltransferase [candidate division KSB1 bacterium]|nr:GNAT family N-acetyltransferase [candidate division KSB1 bacterium]
MKEVKVIIETHRLRLRELVPGDLDNIMRMFGDAATMRFLPGVQTREEGAAWIAAQRERYVTDRCGYWACELSGTGQFIGYAGLNKQEVNGRAELRISHMFLPAFEHGGYAGEALRGCLNYGFEKFKIMQIVALIPSDNELSVRVAQRVGMTLGKTTVYKESVHGIWGVQRRG